MASDGASDAPPAAVRTEDDDVEVVEVVDLQGEDAATAPSGDGGGDSDVQGEPMAEHPTTESAGQPADEDDDVQVVETPDGGTVKRQTQSVGVSSPLKASRATTEREFRCILCHDVLFKPVSIFCGHSFCRVCLMESLLSRAVDDAQCPTCRASLFPLLVAMSTPSALFNVNVTLWNAIQLLLPAAASARDGQSADEEATFTLKRDEVDAKWTIHELQSRADAFHDGERSEHDEIEDEDAERARLYPEIKTEHIVDGRLTIERNIVLDTTDANEDGYQGMNVALALVEFPSVFELYNEHESCELALVKLEEDEERADGAPFFLAESGDDDILILTNYFNEVTLRVLDDADNCVLERTRGAQRGTVSFPGLRLDVPGGVYTFEFADDLYGVRLCVTTALREPHEVNDAPLPEYISLVNNEASEGRRGRRRHRSESEEEEEDNGGESDDSFIVDDGEGEEITGAFSDGEEGGGGGEGAWQYSSDDEERDERRERRRVRRQQRQRVVELVDDEEDDEEHDMPRQRRRNGNQIVDSDDEHHDDDEVVAVDAGAGEGQAENEEAVVSSPRRSVIKRDVDDEHESEDEDRPAKRRRRGHIVNESESDADGAGDENEDEEETGFRGADEDDEALDVFGNDGEYGGDPDEFADEATMDDYEDVDAGDEAEFAEDE